MTFHEFLLQQSTSIRNDIYHSSFVQGIGSDNLSQTQRDYYVAQDTYYTDYFGKLFDLTTEKLTPLQQASKPVSTDGQTAHDALLASQAMLNIPPDQHNLAYLEHMEKAIMQGDATNAMLALLPCTESYHLIGTHFINKFPNNTYEPWLAYYTSPDYKAFTQWSWQVVDQQVPDWQKLSFETQQAYLSTYLTSYQYELTFWDQAARH